MKYRARNAARDANEPDIVEALKRNGLSVERLDQPLDLLVGYGGITKIVEVKDLDDTKARKPKKYTKKQLEFIDVWLGGFTRICTVDDVADFARNIKSESRAMQAFTLQAIPQNVMKTGSETVTTNDRPPSQIDTEEVSQNG